jgi:hypothetical protein
MIKLLKAIPLGILLTVIVCLFMGSGGSSGGVLNVHRYHIDISQIGVDFRMYWSWVLFVASTGLAWALMLMMMD